MEIYGDLWRFICHTVCVEYAAMLCVVAETQGSKVGLTTGVLLEDLQHRSLCKAELGF